MNLDGPFCEYRDSTCVYCGVTTKRPDAKRNCVYKLNFVAVGDSIADTLKAFGITEKAMSRWLGYSCGCGKRRRALNKFGYFMQEKAAKAAVSLRKGLLGG